MDRFLDIRRLALGGCVAYILSAVYPGWTACQEIFGVAAAAAEPWRVVLAVAMLAIGVLLSLLPPAFLFLLYRNRAHLSPTLALRRLALIAGIVFTGIEIVGGIAWIRSSGTYFVSISMLAWASGGAAVREAQSDPRTPAFLSNALALIFNLGLILILIALFGSREEEARAQADVGVPFRRVSHIALIAGYAVLGFGLLRIAYIPGILSSVRSTGRTPPSVADLLTEMVTGLLLTACMTAIPFIVHRSLPPQKPLDAE